MAKKSSLTAEKIMTEKQWRTLAKELERYKEAAITQGTDYKYVHDFYLLSLGWMTGLRISEVSSLNWSDIGDDQWLLVRNGKGNKDRTVFFGKKTDALINQYFDFREKTLGHKCTSDEPIFRNIHRKRYKPSGIGRRTRFWIDKTSLPRSLSYHSLRHGFATRMLNKGVGVHDLKEILGHSNIAVTSIYLHFTEESRSKFRQLL